MGLKYVIYVSPAPLTVDLTCADDSIGLGFSNVVNTEPPIW